ncbi:MAG: flavodoxin domain-containing protein [Lachnospiraceae bacterium]|nr:flavodoxin domain-containing protein [Lachnospiraceae bacterium]
MKTIIIYATKSGATREIAERIAKKLGDTVLYDIKQGTAPAIEEYDNIIIGSSVYAGAFRKEAKEYLINNKDSLLKAAKDKNLIFYISGLDPSGEKTGLSNNVPPELLEAAKAAYFLGGVFDPKTAGTLGRLAIKVIAKLTDYTDTIDNPKIDQLVELIK